MEPERQAKLTSRLPELDGLRGIAILLVFVFHCFPDRITLGPFWAALRDSSWLGVDLFFVISGFLITRILMATRDDPNRYSVFYGRRTLRIFPLYYFVLTAIVVAQWLSPLAQQLFRNTAPPISYWTYTFNLHVSYHDQWPQNQVLNHFWSLSVEEQFYLVWPFLVFSVARKSLPRLMGAVLLVALASRLALYGLDCSWVSIYSNTLARVDSFALGGLAAYLHCYASPKIVLPGMRVVFYGSGLGLLGFGFVHQGINPFLMVTQLVIATVLAVFFASWIYLSVNDEGLFSSVRWALRWPWLSKVGHYSYGIYIYHWPIWFFMATRLPPSAPGLEQWKRTLIGAFLTMVVSVLSYHFLEKPFLNKKDDWVAYLSRRSQGKEEP